MELFFASQYFRFDRYWSKSKLFSHLKIIYNSFPYIHYEFVNRVTTSEMRKKKLFENYMTANSLLLIPLDESSIAKHEFCLHNIHTTRRFDKISFHLEWVLGDVHGSWMRIVMVENDANKFDFDLLTNSNVQFD